MKIMPVQRVGAVSRCMSSPQSYASEIRYGTATPARIAAIAMEKLAAARLADEQQHAANLPAIENNRAVRAAVAAMMAEIGMPTSYTVRDERSRSRFPKTKRQDAGYLSDLSREVPIDDGWASAEQTYVDLLKRYQSYSAEAEKAAEREKELAAQAQQREVEKRRADMELAAILLRYQLPIESSWSDVLEELRKRDQRIDLAVAMRQTRGDWSEGPYRVRNALDRFKVESTEDLQIANDVLACMEDFCDGRVFRDTTWSYDRLFASAADQQLSADAQAAMNRAED